MKLQTIKEKYRTKELTISGMNLSSAKAHFGSLTDLKKLNYNIVYYKGHREIREKYNHPSRYGEPEKYRQMNQEIDAFDKDLNEKYENGLLALTERQTTLLELLENLYYEGLETEHKITPIEVKDGKAIIPKSKPYHRCWINNEDNLAKLETISDLGLIASEWFGIYEAEGEGRFCVFAQTDEVKTYPETKPLIKIYFDETSDYWKKLASYDHFEYLHIKNTNPDMIEKIYPPEIIALYEEIISPLSSTNDFHSDPSSEEFTWMALPGGIPPQLIAGIKIQSTNTLLMENLEKIQKLFPNAVIFDENNKVLDREINKENE